MELVVASAELVWPSSLVTFCVLNGISVSYFTVSLRNMTLSVIVSWLDVDSVLLSLSVVRLGSRNSVSVRVVRRELYSSSFIPRVDKNAFSSDVSSSVEGNAGLPVNRFNVVEDVFDV